MRKWLTRTRAPITWALTVTFVTVLAATCLVQAQMRTMTPTQHAAARPRTGDAMPQTDCCAAQEGPALAASASVPLPPPAAVIGPVPFVPEPPSPTWADVDFERSPLKLDGTPTHLRISTFRI